MGRKSSFGQSNEDCIWISFIFLFFIILFIIIAGCGCVYGPKISTFTNSSESVLKKISDGGYMDWDDQLDYLKKNFGIGLPTGVLSYLPDQSSCDTNSNLLVQSNVAFKPNRHNTGCTYADMRYPE